MLPLLVYHFPVAIAGDVCHIGEFLLQTGADFFLFRYIKRRVGICPFHCPVKSIVYLPPGHGATLSRFAPLRPI